MSVAADMELHMNHPRLIAVIRARRQLDAARDAARRAQFDERLTRAALYGGRRTIDVATNDGRRAMGAPARVATGDEDSNERFIF